MVRIYLGREYKRTHPMSIVAPESLFYRIHGQETASTTPIVFLHGLMGFAANWGKIWPKLSSNHKILVYDQRGHGRSPKPPAGYSPSDYANDLHALLQHIGWEKAHIVGHSMGGRVALRFCALYPESAASLVMEDSGAESRPERLTWIRELLGSIPTPFPDRESAKSFFESHFQNDKMTGTFLHANLEEKAEGKFDWRFHAPGMIETVATGRATDAMPELVSLKMPALFIRGGRSAEFPADEAERMQRALKDSVLKTIPNAGHFVHAEKPEEFSALLLEFFSHH